MGRMDRGKQLVDRAKAAGPRARELRRAASQLDIPWARCAPARAVRETIQSFMLGPVVDLYVRRRSRGREHFAKLKPPVIMVANHGSHLDTPVILRALPRRWRQRTAVAAAADYFYRNRLVAATVALIFNTVPVSRSGGGLVQGAADHIHKLIDQRWNLLLYPEGTRSRSGEVGKLRSGAAVLAHEHGIAIVPMHVSGTRAAMPPGRVVAAPGGRPMAAQASGGGPHRAPDPPGCGPSASSSRSSRRSSQSSPERTKTHGPAAV